MYTENVPNTAEHDDKQQPNLALSRGVKKDQICYSLKKKHWKWTKLQVEHDILHWK